MERDRSSQECIQGLNEGRDADQDILRNGPHVENNRVQLLASLLDADRRWTERELATEVGVCHKTVLHILHGFLVYRKLATRWISMEFPRCNNGTTMQSQRSCWTGTKEKVMTFLDESSLWTKPGLPHTNQT